MAAVLYGSASADDTIKFQPSGGLVKSRSLLLRGKPNDTEQHLFDLRYQGTKIPAFKLKALKKI